MSLDVYLEQKGAKVKKSSPVIYIRENGQSKSISREEWDSRYPGRTPFIVNESEESSDEVYHGNITHNLIEMADKAGIYKYLWEPETLGIVKAFRLIDALQNGLTFLRNNSTFCKQFNPSNGWGSYEVFVDFVQNYLDACIQYPDANVFVSR